MKTAVKNKVVPLELLAPARTLGAGKLAIANGADSVYIASPRFGARQAAGNSWEDVSALVRYAHIFGARVYLVLNTIFFDEEIGAMQDSLDKAGNSGVDALIIQDPGIFNLRLPALPIFMSTQAHNISLEQVLFWEKIGCQRVILGRELSIEEITEIRRHSQIELESFVHGALCVSYSGRCYLSQQMSGRSANRGVCTQACRLPYRLLDANGRLLSGTARPWLCLKDFRAEDHLGELIEAGITSFKIEGRLKDDTYVANVTAAYRLALDKIIAQSQGSYIRASFGRIDLSYEPDLNKSFNRDYTNYFLKAQRQDWLALGPNSLGEKVGRITAGREGKYQIESTTVLKPGEGLVFTRGKDIIGGAYLNQTGPWYKFNKVLALQTGDLVFRNENPEFEKRAQRGAQRLLASDWSCRFSKQKAYLTVSAENGATTELDFSYVGELAKDQELASANLQRQLFKLGASHFYGRNFSVSGEIPFLALSLINQWRRQVLEILEKDSLRVYQGIALKPWLDNKQAYPEKELDYSYNVANQLARDFYVRHGARVKEEAVELSGDFSGRPLMTTKHCLRFSLGACPKQGGAKKLVEPLYLENEGRRYRLAFDCQRCVMELFLEEKKLD